MDPSIDKELAGHVLQSHVFRKPGESDGEALRIETSADVIIAEKPDVCHIVVIVCTATIIVHS